MIVQFLIIQCFRNLLNEWPINDVHEQEMKTTLFSFFLFNLNTVVSTEDSLVQKDESFYRKFDS